MKGLDTNILVRYLVQDDAIQSPRATRFFVTECTDFDPGWISQIVLCEMVWVLESAYRYQRRVIANLLEHLLRAPQVRIEHSDEVRDALGSYRAGIDFSDSLIGATNRRAGCDYTVTFDRKAAAGRDFRLLR